MSKLLLDESPIPVLPSLAIKIGLSEAIFIQQLHYWLKDSNNVKEGFKWVYNTYDDWKVQFPWWSISTIRRIITKLEKSNLIIIGNFNKMKIDNTKWYRINYDLLEDMSRPSVQNEQTECSDWTSGDTNLNRPLPEITTEITLEKKEEEVQARLAATFQFYEQNGFGTLGGYIAEKIGQWCDELSPELVLKAMQIAVEYSVKKWRYVERILCSWMEMNYKTVEQVDAALLEFKEKQAKQRDRPKNKNKYRTEILPDWFEDAQYSKSQTASSNANSNWNEINDLLKDIRGNQS